MGTAARCPCRAARLDSTGLAPSLVAMTVRATERAALGPTVPAAVSAARIAAAPSARWRRGGSASRSSRAALGAGPIADEYRLGSEAILLWQWHRASESISPIRHRIAGRRNAADQPHVT